ncbi:MAG: hypothetical protein HY868_24255 [Chloroflexi bacterium]|nr:hypothetical protein [Chloroflexota bacterium]
MSARVLATNDLIGEHLRAGRDVRFTIPTASMLPLLAPGDAVIVQPLAARAVRVGDIIVHPVNHVWLAHRLIERRVIAGEDWFVTKGDNQPVEDRAWQPGSYEGVVGARARDGRIKHLRSTRIRILFQVIAQCSRWQAQSAGVSRNLVRRIMRRACRILVFAIASLAWWMAG